LVSLDDTIPADSGRGKRIGSVMLMLNIPDLYAQHRGGWATKHTMKAVYQHLMDSKRSAVDSTIDEYFYGLMEIAGTAPQNM